MINYLITNETVALLKRKNKTIIYSVDKVEFFNININKILEYNCSYYGATLNGRKKCAKSILNLKYKIPIIVDDKNNMILIQISSPRNDDCLYIMANKIVDYKKVEDKLEIICLKNNRFITNISEKSLEKLLINSIKLNNILNWRKNANFLL